MMEDNRTSFNKSLLSQEKLGLKSWGLPQTILEKYSAKGIENMFPWQVECLTCNGVLSGRNLVYSAPTSAGKTMVAEILTIQTVLERKKKVIFILPFVSVVREKMLYFQNLLGSSGVRVEGFMGSHAPPGGLRTVHVAVCTIEKANSLINRLLEDQGLDAVGCVVVDELHLLGDPHRGYLLELLLTKIKYMCRKDKTLNIQVVGMSATLPNLQDMATWLDAALYITQFRPIPLTEYLKVNSSVYDASTMELKYNVQPPIKFKSDPGDVIHLCLESLLAGHSVLVFCPTRGWCETSAQQIAAEFRRIGYEKSEVGLAVRGQLDGGAISDVIEQLKRSPAGLDPSLGRSVAFGVAFHHAGLTMDERDIVEGAFRNSVLRVLVATSTLSSGVNLPARRVLIRCPTRNMDSDVRSYRQMVGRAGRMGKDTAGESFLICNGSERCVGEQLVRSQLPPVESSLISGDLSSSLKRAILEVIASGVVNTSEDVELYTSCTFLASSATDDVDSSLADPLTACVEYLQANEFIRVSGGSLGPTPLAEACLSASLPPDQGLKLLKELHRARQCFVLETELHIIYQVTPYSVSDQWGELDWLRVLSLWEDLPISMKRVGELVGVEERFLVGAVRGTVNMKNSAQKLSIHRRFYTALALQDLVNEVPLPQVAVKFSCSKGVLQSLQQSASTFAGMVTQFTRRLGWSNVELLVSQFGARLQFGAQRELLDLLRLDCLTAVQARALYNSGIQALADLATASVSKVERALARATPFHSEQEAEGQDKGNDKCCIWLVGRCAVSETKAADILVHEARQYLERELGLQSANWGDLNSSADSSTCGGSFTQALDIPVRPIGQEIKKNDNSEERKALDNENNARSQEKQLPNHCIEISLNNVSETKSIACHQITNQGENNCFKKEHESPKNNDSKTNGMLKSGFSTPISNISNINNKRGSLDLFDSPDAATSDHDQLEKLEENYEVKNSQLQTHVIENLQSSSIQKTIESQMTTSKSVKSNLNLNPQFKDVSKDSSVLPNNLHFNNENVFLSSPEPTEAKSAFLEKLDANLGGESLLEMSSFAPETNEVSVVDLVGSHSREDCRGVWELSSFVDQAAKRKRKISIGNASHSKRFKMPTKYYEQLQRTPEASELQVPKITSSNSKMKPLETSTPTLSQYFAGSIDFASPFLDNNKHIDCTKNNNESANHDLFVDSNEDRTNHVHSYQSIICSGEKSHSFELKISNSFNEHDSFIDCDLNVNSKIFDDLDSESNNFSTKEDNIISTTNIKMIENEFNKSLALNNSMSKSSKFNTENRENEQHAKYEPKINLLEPDCTQICENNCFFQDSLVIDSKLNALIDMNQTQTKNKKADDSSKLSDRSGLKCEKLDVKTAQENKLNNAAVEHCCNYSKQFEISEFDMNTQMCNIIDNVIIDNKKANCNKNIIAANSRWTESMEIKEIQNLNFDDEETVFGTPVPHQKSILLKKPNRMKAKNEKSMKLINNESLHAVEVLVPHPLKNYEDQNTESLPMSKDTDQSSCNHHSVRYGKRNNINVHEEVGTLPEKLDSRCDSMTDSFLELALENPFSQEIQAAMEDDILSSQGTPGQKFKALNKRVENADSPSVNKSKSQVEVMTVNDAATRQEFRSRLFSCKSASLVLTTRVVEADGGGRKIGARIVNKTPELSYPCTHRSLAVTSAVVCCDNSSVYVVTLDHRHYTANLEVLREMVSRRDLVICSWEAKRVVLQLQQCCQLKCVTRLSDPTIAEWLLKPHQLTPTLKQMARSYGVQAPQCSDEAGFTALLVWELCFLLKAKLKQCGLYKSYTEVEMPTQQVLAEMEDEGVNWDREYVEILWTATEDKMADLQNRLYTLTGKKFNLRSRTDLAKINKFMKESCEDKLMEFNETLRNWRVLNSLKTRNMSTLLMQEAGRIRGSWDTHTLTGRISMQEPNLQHVPRDITVDDQVFSLRSAFVASPGCALVSADFSQLELRLLAHFSQDAALQETFTRPGDVFTAIAAEWHRLPQQQVGAELRHHTKQLCYGLIYGMGLSTLAEEMGVDVGRAGEMVASFHRTYPGLQVYVDQCVAACRASTSCHVTTLLGRRRFLPDINSHNKTLRAQAERQAVNTTIQGSAADIAKTAMLRVRQAARCRGLTVRLIIHLHDELIYEVEQNNVDDFLRILREEMEGAVALSVPLPVKVKKGPSWGQMELID